VSCRRDFRVILREGHTDKNTRTLLSGRAWAQVRAVQFQSRGSCPHGS
jgi:hypothetical protein